MKKMHHIVLVKFKAGAEGTYQPLADALARLQPRLEGFLHISSGPYDSPEGANQGYTHGFLMTFRDAAARDYYLFHPEHEKVKQQFLPAVEQVVAFDFEE